MPVQECTLDGKPGLRWGSAGTCYTHDGTDAGRAAARDKALKQAAAMGEFPGTGRNNELDTVDIEGVELFSVGGPVHAIGSPPQGDNWTADDLRAMAAAAAELGDELKAPARLGHRRMGETQDGALRISPAVGWIDNQRVNEDGTKLIGDLRRVPAKVANLVKAGALRTRSAELSKITSQRTGKTYDYVVSGLAWLGDKLPAVQTLEDVVALYSGDAGAVQRYVVFEPDADLERLHETIATLTGLLADEIAGAADTRPDMPESKFTEEQRKAFQAATGLEEAKVTDELLIAAGVKPETDDGGDGGSGDGGDGSGGEDVKEMQAQIRAAEQRAKDAEDAAKQANETLRLNQQASDVDQVIRDGKEEPGRRDDLVALHEGIGHEKFVAFYEKARVDETLVREYGSDDDGTDKPTEEQTRALESELEGIFPGYESQKVAA